MSDDLPTPDRLGRIERGVQRRIDRRRQVARQIAGASVAVLLVAGGVALVRPLLLSSSGGSASSAGGSGAGSSAGRTTTVVCHDAATTRKVRVGEGEPPSAAIAACVDAARRAATADQPADRGPSPFPSPASVVCESTSGVLHVYLGDAASCVTHQLRPYSG